MVSSNKTQAITVSRSRTLFPEHSDLLLCGTSIAVTSSLKLLGVTIDNKVTFEKHIRMLAFSISQNTGLLKKCYRCFRDREIIKNLSLHLYFFCFEYCSVIWLSTAA